MLVWNLAGLAVSVVFVNALHVFCRFDATAHVKIQRLPSDVPASAPGLCRCPVVLGMLVMLAC